VSSDQGSPVKLQLAFPLVADDFFSSSDRLFAVSLNPDIYYGQSARNLARIFDQAFKTPAILFIDEFESFGKKVDKADSPLVQSEDLRVQSIFLSSLRRVVDTRVRAVVIAATNVFESIREDVRRRAFVLDMDRNQHCVKELP